MAFAGIIAAIIGAKLLSSDTIKLIGVLISITGMFVIAASSLLPPRRTGLRQADTAVGPEQLTPAPTTKKLTPMTDFEPVGSVTDHTTELLVKVPAAKR